MLSEVFVPDDFVTDIYGSGLTVDTPLFRLPVFSRLAFNKVGVATGVARAALDAFRALATVKTPFRTSDLLRERPQAQLAVAEAEARLRAARAFVFEAVDDVWQETCAGRKATVEQQAMVRLACSHCCAEAVRAVEIVYAQAGITASSPRSPLEHAIPRRPRRTAARHGRPRCHRRRRAGARRARPGQLDVLTDVAAGDGCLGGLTRQVPRCLGRWRLRHQPWSSQRST